MTVEVYTSDINHLVFYIILCFLSTQFALHYNIPPPPDALAFQIKGQILGLQQHKEPSFTLTTL